MRSLGLAAVCVSSAMAWGDAQYFGRGELPMAVCEAASPQNESVDTFVDSIIEPSKPRKGVLACSRLDHQERLISAHRRGTFAETYRHLTETGECSTLRSGRGDVRVLTDDGIARFDTARGSVWVFWVSLCDAPD